jgi:lysylphosphatidylglycerol synthetase-like protein (DUF2156 family)
MSAMALLLAFVLGHVIAWTYIATHSGLSYSRSFVQSMVVLPIILALMIVVMASNVVVAFGLMGAVAIVRFRNILKDTRDTAFLLLALVVGLGVGTRAFEVSALGTVAVCGVVLLLHYTSFGTRHRFDVILSFRLSTGAGGLGQLDPIFYRYCRKAILASQRVSEATDAGDFSYRLLLRDPERTSEMVEALSAAEGVSRISVIQRDDESEV